MSDVNRDLTENNDTWPGGSFPGNVNTGSDSINGLAGDDSIDGGNGNDSLDGGDDNDTLIGGAGNDELYGANGNDRLLGGIGNDTLSGGLADDTLLGEAGDDSLIGATETADWMAFTAAVTVSLGALGLDGAGTAFGEGSDSFSGIENVLASSVGADSLLGDAQGNFLSAGDGANVIAGAAGNDTLVDGNTGNGSLAGGLGDDSLVGGTSTGDWAFYGDATGSVTADLSALVPNASGAFGNDTLSGIENIRGGNSDDHLTGNSLANNLVGGTGDDSLFGGAGGDEISGGLGNDLLSGGEGSDAVDYGGTGAVTVDLLHGTASGALGDDTLTGFEVVRGSSAADSIRGDNLANFFYGTGHGDTIDGAGGDDWFGPSGFAGSSSLYGGEGNDGIGNTGSGHARAIDLGENGSVRIGGLTGLQTETLNGFENASGGGGSDTLIGNSGTNWLLGWGSSDSLFGGEGDDWASYAGAPSSVTVNLAAGTTSGGHGSDNLTGIENVLGSSFNDSILGNTSANVLNGAGGDDTLDGGNAADWASYANATGSVTVDLVTGRSTGADGNDSLIRIEAVLGGNFDDSLLGDSLANTLEGGLGNDTLVGGNALDYVSYLNASGSVTVNLGAGSSAGADGNDSLIGIEGILGSDHDDSLLGGNGDSQFFYSYSGNDTIIAGDGNSQFIFAGDGADSLTGGNGSSQNFRGEAGNDTLVGGESG
jgi:Ca2+-binding RTX toxin-like protein